ncbi:MAG TPA: response regulator, partial [Burkholderiaceae bacterium]
GLPDMNGYQLVREMRAAPWGRCMLLVAATGWGQPADRERALDAGFDRHLTKPVALPELLAALRPAGPAGGN